MNQQSLQIERCPYLGLHDDASTSLAYPSHWNYCYHAEPATSILVDQQVNICLGIKYLECPLIAANKWGRLPRKLRGRAGVPTSRLLWLVLSLLLLAALILFLFLSPHLLTF